MIFFLGSNFNLSLIISFMIVAIFAFAYHELGHAIAADRLGDMTPRSYGRMTLNPIPHLDRVGMIMLLLIGFGWAVTPINPNSFRGNPRTSHAIVAIAGPLANLIMACFFAIPLRLVTSGILTLDWFFTVGDFVVEVGRFFEIFFITGVRLNLFLIAFNLLPIPPLDGFWVLRGVVPMEMSYQLDRLLPYGMMLFLAVIFILPLIGIDIFPLINEFTSIMFSLLVGI